MLKKYDLVEIAEIKDLPYRGDVYDIEVEEDHSYNIEGIAVHNSCCTTRLVAGVGYPQLSTIDECSDAAHGLGGLICSDGGCRTPGDVAKAFAAGADFVMLGGMLSGTDECEGEWIEEDGKKLLKFHGMSSKEAQEKWNGGLAEYRAAEGKEVKIPYRGSVETVIQQILGGIRSACTYTGARRLKDLPKCASFVRVSRTHNTVYSQ